jgi:D-sedoheptulose 7-phosphate isomerase
MNQQIMTNRLDEIYTEDAREFAGRYLDYLKTVLDNIDRDAIAAFIHTIVDARERGAAIFFIGNGGSAATASHFANDIGVGSNAYEKPFRAISLTDNVPVITALANDFGYDEIFERQLRVLSRPGDVLVAISASGNSPNLVRALEYAAGAGLKSVGITAFSGGKLKEMADLVVHVPTGKGEYGPAEDAHMVLDHLVGAYLIRLVRNA